MPQVLDNKDRVDERKARKIHAEHATGHKLLQHVRMPLQRSPSVTTPDTTRAYVPASLNR